MRATSLYLQPWGRQRRGAQMIGNCEDRPSIREEKGLLDTMAEQVKPDETGPLNLVSSEEILKQNSVDAAMAVYFY
jgi:hypothetical protein